MNRVLKDPIFHESRRLYYRDFFPASRHVLVDRIWALYGGHIVWKTDGLVVLQRARGKDLCLRGLLFAVRVVEFVKVGPDAKYSPEK